MGPSLVQHFAALTAHSEVANGTLLTVFVLIERLYRFFSFQELSALQAALCALRDPSQLHQVVYSAEMNLNLECCIFSILSVFHGYISPLSSSTSTVIVCLHDLELSASM